MEINQQINQQVEENVQRSLASFIGAIEMEVRHRDGSKETIKIRQLPVSLYLQYFRAIDDESKLLELLCDKPAGWSDTLEMSDFQKMVTEGENLNRDFFTCWLERRVKRSAAYLPAIQEKLSAELASKNISRT